MRFNYIDVYKAAQDANKLLKEQKSDEIIETTDTFNYISIKSINKKTKQEVILREGLNRDEAFYWIEGLNTGLLNNK